MKKKAKRDLDNEIPVMPQVAYTDTHAKKQTVKDVYNENMKNHVKRKLC